MCRGVWQSQGGTAPGCYSLRGTWLPAAAIGVCSRAKAALHLAATASEVCGCLLQPLGCVPACCSAEVCMWCCVGRGGGWSVGGSCAWLLQPCTRHRQCDTCMLGYGRGRPACLPAAVNAST